DKAEISASFDIAQLPDLQAWLRESEFPEEDQQLLVRRVIFADGRSRAFINGMQATVQQLREAGDFLDDINSQHAHHSLLKQAYQRQILDAYAGLQELVDEVARQYRIWRDLHERRVEMERNAVAYAEELA